MMLFVYIHSLTGRVFKILPLKEREVNGEDVYLKEYIEGLWNDMRGASASFPELDKIPDYVTVCNKISFLNSEDFDVRTCKKEVFGALRLLNKLEEALGGESVG